MIWIIFFMHLSVVAFCEVAKWSRRKITVGLCWLRHAELGPLRDFTKAGFLFFIFLNCYFLLYVSFVKNKCRFLFYSILFVYLFLWFPTMRCQKKSLKRYNALSHLHVILYSVVLVHFPLRKYSQGYIYWVLVYSWILLVLQTIF